MDINKKIETILDFSYYDGTEYGEMLQSLVELYCRRSQLDQPLIDMLEKEIEMNYDFILENYEKVSHTETRSVTLTEWTIK